MPSPFLPVCSKWLCKRAPSQRARTGPFPTAAMRCFGLPVPTILIFKGFGESH
jgi:hypothetical protein